MLILIFVFLAALALRLIYLYQYYHSPFWDLLFLDTESHQRMAQRILNGQGLGTRACFRSPAYFYLLAGLEYLGHGSLWAPRIFQSVLGSISASLAGLLAFRLTGKRWAALLAGLALACFWLSIYFDGELLIESSACFLNLLALLLLTRNEEPAAGNQDNRSLPLIISTGAVMGLASIFRPNFLLFAIGILAVWLWKKRFRQLIILTICTALPVLPISLRNLVVAKDPVLIASQDGINFWVGNGPLADGRSVILPYMRFQLPGEFLARMKSDPWFKEDVWLVSVYGAEQALARPLKESEVSSYWMRESFREMASSPRRTFRLLLKKCLFLVSSTVVSNNRDLNYHREQIPLLSLLGKFHLGIIWPFALLGLALGFFDPKNHNLVLYFFLYGASVVLFFVTSRYLMPLLPALSVLAALGLAKLGEYLKQKRWLNAVIAVILLAAFAWLSNARLVKWNDRPLRAGMRLNLGLAMSEKGRFADAAKTLAEAVEIKPSSAEARLALANALALSGRPEESLKHYQAALFFEPELAEAHYDLGLTLLKLHQPESAYDHFAQAHQLKPEIFPAPEKVLEKLLQKD